MCWWAQQDVFVRSAAPRAMFLKRNYIGSFYSDTGQGGITCGAIDEPKKSSKAIDKRVIIEFRDKNVVIARFRDKNVVTARFRNKNVVNARFRDKNKGFIF